MTETPNQTSKPAAGGKGCPRWIRIALFVSVAANLLIVGAVAGALLRNDGRHGRPADIGAGVNTGLGPYAQALTREQRKALSQAIAGKSGPLGDNAKALRAQVRRILDILRDSDFTPGALQTELQEAQARLTERQAIALAVVVEQISQMSAEERAGFADRLERSFKRKPPRRRE